MASARLSVDLTNNQYKAGIVGFLNVVAAQSIRTTSARSCCCAAAASCSSVALVQALGGGWRASPGLASR